MPFPCCSEVTQKAIKIEGQRCLQQYDSIPARLSTAPMGWTLPVLQAVYMTTSGPPEKRGLESLLAVPFQYDFQPHSCDKIPDNRTRPSALPGVPGITSSIPSAAHSLCATAHVQQACHRLVFSLTLSNWTISGSFTGCAWFRETWGLLWCPCP